jgi:hypothetical protein
MVIDSLGAVIFGLAVGWLACRLLWQKTTASWIHTLIALGGIVTAAAVLALFDNAALFGWYAIGLFLTLLVFVALRIAQPGNQHRQPWRETLVELVPAATVSASRAAPAVPQPEDGYLEEPVPAAASVAELPLTATAAETLTDPDPANTPTAIRPLNAPTATGSGEAETPTERTRGSRKSTSQRKRATDE